MSQCPVKVIQLTIENHCTFPLTYTSTTNGDSDTKWNNNIQCAKDLYYTKIYILCRSASSTSTTLCSCWSVPSRAFYPPRWCLQTWQLVCSCISTAVALPPIKSFSLCQQQNTRFGKTNHPTTHHMNQLQPVDFTDKWFCCSLWRIRLK